MKAYNLRHVTLSPDLIVKLGAFFNCKDLERLTASVGFKVVFNIGHFLYTDNTVVITAYLKWCWKMDDNKELYKTTTSMLKLCNRLDISGSPCVTTNDPNWAFLAGPGRDLTDFVLLFKLGAKKGKGDLKEARIVDSVLVE